MMSMTEAGKIETLQSNSNLTHISMRIRSPSIAAAAARLSRCCLLSLRYAFLTRVLSSKSML